MKTLKFLFFGLILFLSTSANAQIGVNVNINIPTWGPADTHDAHFYYIPDIQVYYDVPNAVFIYPYKERWIRCKRLPAHYSHFDLHSGCKVILPYRGHSPYEHFYTHKSKYPKGYIVKGQKPYKSKGNYGHHYGEGKHESKHGHHGKHGKGH